MNPRVMQRNNFSNEYLDIVVNSLLEYIPHLSKNPLLYLKKQYNPPKKTHRVIVNVYRDTNEFVWVLAL
jgi:hypothetical protein